jgi:hypothetical protein
MAIHLRTNGFVFTLNGCHGSDPARSGFLTGKKKITVFSREIKFSDLYTVMFV